MPEQEEQIEVSSNPQLEAMRGLIPEEEFEALQAKVEPTKPVAQKSQEEIAAEQEAAEKAEADRLAAEQAAQNNQGKTQEQIDSEKAEAEKKAAEAAAEAEKNKKESTPPAKKSVLGFDKKKETAKALVIEKPEQILEAIKSKYGQELKDFSEMPKFFESVDKMRVSAQKAEQLEKENKDFKALWEEKLPAEFIEAAMLHLQGNDFRQAFTSKPAFDFNKPAEKQDTKALVNHYFPGKFTDDDFAETEESAALAIAKQASVDKFNFEKSQRDSKSAETAKKAQEQINARKQAAEGSLNYLKQSFPEVEESVVNNIKSTIEGGQQSVISLFFNSDGTAKPQAAEMLLMAIHGKDEITTAMEIAANRTESQINEDLVTRGADTKKPVQTGTAPKPQISEETKKKLEEMERIAAQGKTTF